MLLDIPTLVIVVIQHSSHEYVIAVPCRTQKPSAKKIKKQKMDTITIRLKKMLLSRNPVLQVPTTFTQIII